MKRLINILITLSILMFGCNISTTATPTVVTAPTIVIAPTIESPTLVDTTVPVATVPTITNNVTCNELSIYLDSALASSYTCETVPANPDGIMIAPQYTNLTLNGYLLSDRPFGPFISVYSVTAFNDIWPGFDVTPLQNLVNGNMPAEYTPFGPSLPFLPNVPAGQILRAQYQVLPFANGSGIRYLTLLAQNYAVINNHDLIYTYQGLTSDGQYWVAVVLPITDSILPENGETVPGGQTYEQFTNNYTPYITDITSQLNSQTSGSFAPTLAALDALVASINVQP